MGKLFLEIRGAVAEDRYLVSLHAYERMTARGTLEWQVIAGLADGKLESERPHGLPNPTVEIRELLPDGTEVKAVWALLVDGWAKLVTVHYYD